MDSCIKTVYLIECIHIKSWVYESIFILANRIVANKRFDYRIHENNKQV